jgi:hypothetical protein
MCPGALRQGLLSGYVPRSSVRGNGVFFAAQQNHCQFTTFSFDILVAAQAEGQLSL